ncbi:hypothetical protein M569_07474 [Genlisea aurea]|uniref:Phospholipase D alpha 1 n=1 Tax=Genlisea aurea TaxID=192259 RepID=S8CQY8_9LAMI|nr:hypothetical protein M569_07474 [Genlisea aurea]
MDSNNNYPPYPYPYGPGYGYPHVTPQTNTYPLPNTPQTIYPPQVHGSYVYPPPSHYPPPYGVPQPGPPVSYPYPSVTDSLSSHGAPYFQTDYGPHSYHYPGYSAPPPPPLMSAPPSPSMSAPPSPSMSAPPSPAVAVPSRPAMEFFGSYQYGSFHYGQHQSSSGRFEVPPKVTGYLNHQNSASSGGDSSVYSDHSSEYAPSYPSVYPAIDAGLSNLQLSDNEQSYHSGPLPRTDKLNSSVVASQAVVPYGGNMQLQRASSSNMSLKVLLLHGNLDIWVYEARNLPNMDMFHKTIGDVFNILPASVSSKIEGQISRQVTSDPYVTVTISNATIARTSVISNSEDPVWMQNFVVSVAHNAAEVSFVVKDNDLVGSQFIGTVSIPIEKIYEGERVQGFFPLLNASGKPPRPGATLSLSIQYTPIELLRVYHCGVGAGPNYEGVPGTYFPLRKGGTVTLYQDAHVPDGSLPTLKLGNGAPYIHGKCWRDIFNAISQARRLIYITGWSVWHQVKLVRDDDSQSRYTLGELLKSKSREGVRVLLLVWDDPTSRNILGYKTDGVMQTHDEETRRFFKHSSVQVLLCPRVAGKRHSWRMQTEVGVIYTHHQKTVIVDTDAGHNRRRIMAFVGGLDLCDGRYDTPQHYLFRTQQTWHAGDYHNPTYTGSTAGCPREPWHDLHCKIDGPAAYDILTNFEERWLKASKPRGIKKLKASYDDALLRIERVPEILGLSDSSCFRENDPEAWHVQVFRSIDSNSVKGFPKDPKEASMRNLVCGKNVRIDMSIHTAYVKAIRSAQRFIYIENQYFIGSSYNWSQQKDVGANNLIPMEIGLKIAEKIRSHERFAVYIVIPMWPEGNPTGAATQRILFWQHKTMQMMYETIYKALVEVGLEGAHSPQDFLNFYCLGNREALDEGVFPENQPGTTPQGLSQRSRRFMIYVHSKGMIVDDEYVVVGSANINQRSMEGTRDTEIAMGAYQPHHTLARSGGASAPQGQIYGYRMSLWAEHLGFLEECFTRPESLECVRRVRSVGEANWDQFASPVVTEMKGHLLKYPVDVDRTGKVRPLPGCETFPDIGGNIVGSFLAIQENLTI